MAALEIYTNCLVYVEGGLLTEESRMSIDRDSRATEMATVAKGFSGVSPGAAIMRVEIENAVPSKDFELNPGKFIMELQTKELTFFAANRTLTTKGFIISDNFSHAVDAPAVLRFSAWCVMADWK